MGFDGPLTAFKQVLADDIAVAEAKRAERAARWESTWRTSRIEWQESFGYKMAPVIDRRMVDRQAREMVALVMKARLLMLFAPMFVMAESIDRSLLIISILASPSGVGPERYAPRNGHVPQYRVAHHREEQFS